MIGDAVMKEGVAHQNPFIEMSRTARVFIIIYFILWRIMPPLFTKYSTDVQDVKILVIGLVTHVVYESMLLFPFVVKKFGGTKIGWLHPLVFITSVVILLGLIRSPANLFLPFTFYAAPPNDLYHQLLAGWGGQAIIWAQTKLKLMEALSVVGLFLGFSIIKIHKRLGGLSDVHGVDGVRFFGLFAILLAAVIFFLEQQGGIVAHMASFAGGRFRMREFHGPFLVVNGVLPFLLIFWYLHKPSTLRNPVFLIIFVVACVLQFIVSGSRSGLFAPVAGLLAAWMIVHHRIPAFKVFLLGGSVILLLGVLGEVRRSGSEGVIDFSLLLDYNVQDAYALTQQELDDRAHGSNVAISAMVPDYRDHALGSTYVGAILFWVPRFIWESKPRGAGAQAAAIFYRGNESAVGYQGGGYPPGAVAEAYWNFSWVGVLFIYFLFGAFLRYCSDWFYSKPSNPLSATLLIMVAFVLPSPSTIALVSFFQSIVIVCAVMLFCKNNKNASGSGHRDMVVSR